MATAPQFATTPKVSWATLTAANTALDGTGSTGRALLFTAGSNGSVLRRSHLAPKGTNVKTVVRFFINNGSDPEVAGNNSLLREVGMAPNTLDQDDPSVCPIEDFDEMVMPAGYRVYGTLGTAVAAGIHVTVEGGDL